MKKYYNKIIKKNNGENEILTDLVGNISKI